MIPRHKHHSIPKHQLPWVGRAILPAAGFLAGASLLPQSPNPNLPPTSPSPIRVESLQ
jgi:hypothetical protein